MVRRGKKCCISIRGLFLNIKLEKEVYQMKLFLLMFVIFFMAFLQGQMVPKPPEIANVKNAGWFCPKCDGYKGPGRYIKNWGYSEWYYKRSEAIPETTQVCPHCGYVRGTCLNCGSQLPSNSSGWTGYFGYPCTNCPSKRTATYTPSYQPDTSPSRPTHSNDIVKDIGRELGKEVGRELGREVGKLIGGVIVDLLFPSSKPGPSREEIERQLLEEQRREQERIFQKNLNILNQLRAQKNEIREKEEKERHKSSSTKTWCKVYIPKTKNSVTHINDPNVVDLSDKTSMIPKLFQNMTPEETQTLEESMKNASFEAAQNTKKLMSEVKKLYISPPDGEMFIEEGYIGGTFNTMGTVMEFMNHGKSPFTGKLYSEMNEDVTLNELGKKKGAMAVAFGYTEGSFSEPIKTTKECGYRVIGDHFFDGEISLNTPQAKKSIENLNGKSFNRLMAHSNGASTTEALIRTGIIKHINELHILGGDRAFSNQGFKELIDSGKVGKIIIWTNESDPVPIGTSFMDFDHDVARQGIFQKLQEQYFKGNYAPLAKFATEIAKKNNPSPLIEYRNFNFKPPDGGFLSQHNAEESYLRYMKGYILQEKKQKSNLVPK